MSSAQQDCIFHYSDKLLMGFELRKLQFFVVLFFHPYRLFHCWCHRAEWGVYWRWSLHESFLMASGCLCCCGNVVTLVRSAKRQPIGFLWKLLTSIFVFLAHVELQVEWAKNEAYCRLRVFFSVTNVFYWIMTCDGKSSSCRGIAPESLGALFLIKERLFERGTLHLSCKVLIIYLCTSKEHFVPVLLVVH